MSFSSFLGAFDKNMNIYTYSDKIQFILSKIGMNQAHKGTSYAKDICLCCILTEPVPLIKEMYISVAEKYGVSAQSVERALRCAIEYTWRYGNLTEINTFFGNSINPEKGKPSNAEFIHMIVQHCK